MAVVTLGRCCGGLLDGSRLLAQLLLCLQDGVLKLGFLVDVAAKKKKKQKIKKSSSDLRGETCKTHTITQCYIYLYTMLAAVYGCPGDMLPPIALE